MGIYLKIALRNLLQARRRSLLLGGAIAFVTALLVIFQSFLQGATNNMRSAALTLSAGHVNVGGFFKETLTDATPVITRVDEIKAVVRESVPEVDVVLDRSRGWSDLVSDTGKVMSALSGVDRAQEDRLLAMLRLAPERAYKEGGSDERKGDLSRVGEPGTITLFAGNAKKLEVVPGDSVIVMAQSLRGRANSVQLTVVAICDDVGMLTAWMSIVSKKTLSDIYQLKPDTTGAVQVYLKDIAKAPEVMERLRGALAAKGFVLMDHEPKPYWEKFAPVMGEDWTGQKLDLTTWDDEVNFLVKMISALNFVAWLLVFILTIIIVVGIINTMWISVRERTGEVGTLRAIGMSRSRVLLMFLVEAVLLGLFATTAGALLGGALGGAIEAAHVEVEADAFKAILLSNTFHFAVTPGQLVTASIVLTLVTSLAALWPAFRASRMQPVTAIQAVT